MVPQKNHTLYFESLGYSLIFRYVLGVGVLLSAYEFNMQMVGDNEIKVDFSTTDGEYYIYFRK